MVYLPCIRHVSPVTAIAALLVLMRITRLREVKPLASGHQLTPYIKSL